MPINPVSGEIKAQSLNDNFSYLDSQIASMSVGPFNTYNNLAALTSDYPNGREGFAIVLETDGVTGYMYTWSGGVWKKGALWQEKGVADGSIDDKKAAPMLLTGAIISRNLKVDFQNQKIVIAARSMVVGRSNKNYWIDAQEFDMTRTNGYLVYNVTTGAIYMRQLGSTGVANDDIIFGIIWAGEVVYIDNMLPTVVTKSTGVSETISRDILSDANQKSTLILGGTGATEARLTKTDTTQILTISGGLTMINPLTKKSIVKTEPFTIDVTDLLDKAGFIILNEADGIFSTIVNSSNLSLVSGEQIFATFWTSGAFSLANSTIPCFFNGRIVNLPHFGEVGELSILTGQLSINTVSKTMEIIGAGEIVTKSVYRYGNEVRINPTLDLTGYVDGATTIFYYDYIANAIKCTQYGQPSLAEIPSRSSFCGFSWGLANMDFYTNADVLVDGQVVQKSKNYVANKQAYAALGDSNTKGLRAYPSETYPDGRYFDQPYPFWVSREYGGALTNIAKSSGRFGGDREIDFLGQVNSVDFADYGVATIGLGLNDWGNSVPKETIQANMRIGLDKIITDNPQINICGLLPDNCLNNNFGGKPDDSMQRPNDNGDTLSDVCDYIAEVYTEYNIPYYDPRSSLMISIRNDGLNNLSDGIHYSQAGHIRRGRQLAEFMKMYL